ncbi:MAG: hypothetical protein PHU85_08245 [Phycisphaerae bacterium]|nr:hypothetical protein [Phycisphaerae bacterium]
MGLTMKKVWLWTKLIVILLVVAWVALFFWKNSDNTTPLWLFFDASWPKVSLDIIIPITAIVSVLVFYVVRKVVGVLGEMSKVRAAEQAAARERRMADLTRDMEKKLAEKPSLSDPPKAGA